MKSLVAFRCPNGQVDRSSLELNVSGTSLFLFSFFMGDEGHMTLDDFSWPGRLQTNSPPNSSLSTPLPIMIAKA